MSFLCWFIIYNFIFWIFSLTLHVKYKYVSIKNWIYILYIMHWCPLSHKYEQLLLSPHFQNPYFFRVKSTFELVVIKSIIKIIFISSSPFALLVINVKILSNFQKQWCTFVRKKRGLKKIRTIHSWGLSVLNMQKHFWFVSNFEHINFAINGKYSTNFYGNSNYHVSLVIFQTYKNVVLRSVHSLRWLLWLCFYPLWFFSIFYCKLYELYKP